jgi:hypothetical protein
VVLGLSDQRERVVAGRRDLDRDALRAQPEPDELAQLGIIGVSVAELVHPSAVAASGGNLVIMPHMHDLPRTQSIVLVMLASLGMTTVPCLFIGRIRKALNVAQRQILLQAWQFRRLGEDLLRSKP